MEGSAPHAALGLIVALLALAALAAQRGESAGPGLPAGGSGPATKGAAVRAEVRALRDGRPLDLNRASAQDLELLPGIGPKLAERIVGERVRRGGFVDARELLEVRGIGPKAWERVRPFVTVDAGAPARAASQKRSIK